MSKDPVSDIVEKIQIRPDGVMVRQLPGENYKDAIIRVALREYLEGPRTQGQDELEFNPE